jgi:protein-disulfide isomerase
MSEYQGKVKFVWRYFPLPGHKNSVIATQAAEAAGEQGKFWEMNDKLFENQHLWGNEQNLPSEQDANAMFVQYAQEIGLNTEQFRQAIESKKFTDKIQRDQRDGQALGVNSTPTFFLNGKKSPGIPTYQQLKQMIEAELQK